MRSLGVYSKYTTLIDERGTYLVTICDNHGESYCWILLLFCLVPRIVTKSDKDCTLIDERGTYLVTACMCLPNCRKPSSLLRSNRAETNHYEEKNCGTNCGQALLVSSFLNPHLFVSFCEQKNGQAEHSGRDERLKTLFVRK